MAIPFLLVLYILGKKMVRHGIKESFYQRFILGGPKAIIAIAAGKGGVGKSVVTVQLARFLAASGKRVGILDADLYGPSVAKMMREDQGIQQGTKGIVPAMAEGISMISLSHFRDGAGASVVRAPVANELISRFLFDVEWGELDFLLIDSPPGTGDIALTLMQDAGLAGVVLVTLPSQISLLDVEKAHQMFVQGQVPVLGLVENMSFFGTGESRSYPLGKGGGRLFAESRGLCFLGEIPLDPVVSRCADYGRNPFREEGDAAKAFLAFGEKFLSAFAGRGELSSSMDLAKRIEKISETSFGIEWSDGVWQEFALAEVQRRCPCIRCKEGVRKVDQNVGATKLSAVGCYALQIAFTSGCSQGIYHFSYLRRGEVE